MNDWESIMKNGDGLSNYNLDVLIQKLTYLEDFMYQAEMHASHPRASEKEREARERIFSLHNAYSDEISTYSIEELIRMVRELTYKLYNTTTVAIRPLLLRTTEILEKKLGEEVGEKEHGSQRRGKHFS